MHFYVYYISRNGRELKFNQSIIHSFNQLINQRQRYRSSVNEKKTEYVLPCLNNKYNFLRIVGFNCATIFIVHAIVK